MNPYSPPRDPIAPHAPGFPGYRGYHVPYVPLGWRFGVAAVSIAATCLTSFAFDGAQLALGKKLDDASDPELTSALVVGGTGLLLVVAHVMAAIFFCVWVYRAAENLRAFGRSGLQFTPGWCVGWFFIPFASLVKPFQALSEVWRASDPRAPSGDDPYTWMASSRSGLLPLWWATWLIGNLFANVSARIDDSATAGSVGLAGSVVSLVAGIACIAMMRGIGARQEAAAASERTADAR